MLTLNAQIRTITGRKTKRLRKTGFIPAVLYGPETKPVNLQVNYKDFAKIYQEAGESSLIELAIGGESRRRVALITEVQRDPISDEIVHVDFFAPKLTEKIEAKVPLIFEGEAPAVKEFGGTLVRNIQEIELKALPQNLPREIRVPLDGLKSFEDRIRIKDLVIPTGTEIIGHDQKEIVAQVVAPEKVEEELAKPVEEEVEKVEKVEKPKKEEVSEEPEKTE